MTFFDHLLQLLAKIPATFWGVVVGSFFTVLGVALTNRAATHRLRAQLEHERSQKAKEREMAMRKEIYLAAVEAVAAGISALPRFADLELPNNAIASDYAAKAPAIPKAHIIAGTDTVQAMVRLTNRLQELHLQGFALRASLLIEKEAITRLDDQIDRCIKEQTRFIELMRQKTLEGTIDQRGTAILNNLLADEQARHKECITERARLANILHPKHLQFLRDCALNTTRLRDLIVPLVSAVRAELELPYDARAYCLLLEESATSQQVAIDEFMRRFLPGATHPSTQEKTVS